MCTCNDCKGLTLLQGKDGVGIAQIINNGDGTYTFILTDGNSFTTSDLTGPQGAQGLQGDPGPQGDPGTNGTDGVGIDNIAWTSNSGGEPQGTQGTTDTYTITLTDASTYTFVVTNGADGTGGTGLSWITLTNAGAQITALGASNIGVINEYDLNAYSQIILPSTGVNIGDVVEIIDNKSNLPSQTRIYCSGSQTIFMSGVQAIGTWTKMECEQGVNGVTKLVYVATNKWAVVSYLYDDGFGTMYPTFLP